MPEERQGHCVVQIDDCKVAVIGGCANADCSVTASPFIQVYNFEDSSWEQGPEWNENTMAFTACSKVTDMKTFETIVIIGCTTHDAGNNAGNNVLTWNTNTNKVEVSITNYLRHMRQMRHIFQCTISISKLQTSDIKCPMKQGGSQIAAGQFKEMNEHHLVFANSDNAEIYDFNLVNGFAKITDSREPHIGGGLVVTKHRNMPCTYKSNIF